MAHTIFKTLKAPIFWILLGALLLRLWGISYGLPLFLVNDETPHVYGALKMIELKTLIPALHTEEFRKVLYYPPLLSYLFLIALSPVIAVHYFLAGAPPLETYRAMLVLDPSFLWIAARTWMALIGVAGIYLSYRVAYRLTGSKRAALFGAVFLSLSFYHLQLSHNVRHWLPASVLLTLLWERALAMREGSRALRYHFLTGAIAGLAAGGVNTAAAVGVIPPFLAYLFGARPFTGRLFSRGTLVMLGAFLAVLLIGIALYPYGLTRAEGAPGAAADISARFVLLAGKSFNGWLSFLGRYVRTLWEFETPLLLLSLAGMVMFWLQRERFWVGVTAAYAVAFFSLLYLFDDFTARGVVFVTPILAVFAGYAAHRVYEKLSVPYRRPTSFLISFFFFFVIFGWQLAVDLRYQWLLSRPDTRLVAREWLLANLPMDSRVLMDAQYLRLPNTPEGAELVEAIDSSALRAADRAVRTLGERAPRPRLAVVNLDLMSPEIRRSFAADPNILIRQGFTHLVVEYRTADGIRDDVRRIAGQGALLTRFDPWKTPRPASYDGSGKLGRLSLNELWALRRFGLFVDVYVLPPYNREPLANQLAN